eukprot:891765-Pleurochrysis_carterae.AAC.1
MDGDGKTGLFLVERSAALCAFAAEADLGAIASIEGDAIVSRGEKIYFKGRTCAAVPPHSSNRDTWAFESAPSRPAEPTFSAAEGEARREEAAFGIAALGALVGRPCTGHLRACDAAAKRGQHAGARQHGVGDGAEKQLANGGRAIAVHYADARAQQTLPAQGRGGFSGLGEQL